MEQLDTRNFDYFSFGNIFTGSWGNLRYRLAPQGEGLTAWVWHGNLCFEKCQVVAQEEFPLTPEGLEAAMEWIGREAGNVQV